MRRGRIGLRRHAYVHELGKIGASVMKDGWTYALESHDGECRWQFPASSPHSAHYNSTLGRACAWRYGLQAPRRRMGRRVGDNDRGRSARDKRGSKRRLRSAPRAQRLRIFAIEACTLDRRCAK